MILPQMSSELIFGYLQRGIGTISESRKSWKKFYLSSCTTQSRSSCAFARETIKQMLNKFSELLNFCTVTELAELSGLSKSYCSQVKHGKRPPSKQLLSALKNRNTPTVPKVELDYFDLFLKSRKASGCSSQTLRYLSHQLDYYRVKVGILTASQRVVEGYLNTIPPK